MTEQQDKQTTIQAVAVLSNEERQPFEVWTRVMGYHRPVASFNRGKQGEFAERQHFKESACSQSL